MTIDKYCPFQIFSNPKVDILCKGSDCELWSPVLDMCSINVGMNAILSLVDAIRGLSDCIKSLDSYQS